MSNVIRVDQEDWDNLLDLKHIIKDYGDDPKYEIARTKMSRLLKYELKHIASV